MKRAISRGAFLVVIVVAAQLAGCASDKVGQGVANEVEYRRVLEFQKQKASTAQDEEMDRKIRELKPSESEKIADRYLQEGNVIMAFIQYNKALQADPSRTAIRYKLGRLFLQKGLVEAGMKEFELILKSNPDNAEAYEGIGRCHLANNEHGKAIDAFKRALNLNPKLWRAHEFLGLIYARQKRYDLAIEKYREAIALQPNSGTLLNNMGMALFLKGEYEQAEQSFLQASPDSPQPEQSRHRQQPCFEPLQDGSIQRGVRCLQEDRRRGVRPKQLGLCII